MGMFKTGQFKSHSTTLKTRRPVSGFTLIEMVVTLTVMAIIGALATNVLWDGTAEKASVESCSQNFRAEFRNLQAQARASKLAHRVVLNLSTHTYTTQKESGTNWVDIDTDKSVGCNLVSTDFTDNVLVFNLRGFPFEGNWGPTSFPSSPFGSDKVLTYQANASSNEQSTLIVKKGTGLIE